MDHRLSPTGPANMPAQESVLAIHLQQHGAQVLRLREAVQHLKALRSRLFGATPEKPGQETGRAVPGALLTRFKDQLEFGNEELVALEALVNELSVL